MITNRHLDKIILAVVLLAVLSLGVIAIFAQQADGGMDAAYAQQLFQPDQVMSVNLLIDEDDWDDLLETAISETYYCCDVEINGETFYRVGIRAKGNTSLSMVAASDSDRYSFKIQFDEYVDGQTCHGLDKLVLNNNYSDATMMREAIVYDMFSFLQADASVYQYASIFVNSEYWGVYLALEAVEESFALRNYGVDYGNFYKPDSMEMGGAGKMEQADTGQFPGRSRQPGGQFAAEGDALTSEEGAGPAQGQPPAAPEGLDFAQQPSGRGGQSGAAALNYVEIKTREKSNPSVKISGRSYLLRYLAAPKTAKTMISKHPANTNNDWGAAADAVWGPMPGMPFSPVHWPG